MDATQKIADKTFPHHVAGVTDASEHHTERLYAPKLIRVQLDEPIIGAKGYFFEDKGLYQLEEGPGVLRAIACTHGGGGSVYMYDSNGKDNPLAERPAFVKDKDGVYKLNPDGTRKMFVMNPNVMGQYMLDFGFVKGLVVNVAGSMCPLMTVTWMKGRNGNGRPSDSSRK